MSSRRSRKKPSPPPTIKQIAQHKGVSTRAVNEWIKGGCPRESLAAIDRWHADNVRPRQGGPRKRRDTQADRKQQSLQQRLNEAKAKDAEEAARTRRVRRRLLQRRLVPINQVVRELAEIFTEVRAIIESIPDAVAKEVPQQLRTRTYDATRNKITAALKKLASLHSVGSADRGA